MATFTNQSKTTATFLNQMAHGKATILNDIKDFVFTDVFFPDGTQLKDVTFAELVDITWTNASKSSTSFSNQSKN
ncbi:hypothetical protein CMI37_10460 [Candidatus Pacearchaeota archaeon]|nr:hypothetical protein [Candidatus Pacearchaeota archaeon]|tara:strand:- start:3484 stop:3708 length:225 start_codon:yes stop_codon:yes gene_type:complete